MNTLLSCDCGKSFLEVCNDFIGHVIWPGLILVIVLMFKKDISELLKRIKKFKIPGGEAVLENEQYEKGQWDLDDKSVNTILKESSNNAIDDLLKNGSPKGLFALYAAYLSNINRKKFTLKVLSINVDLLSIEYTYGFLVGVSSLGVFTFNSHDEPFLITSMNDYLKSKIKDTVYAIAKKDKEDDGSTYLFDQLKAIEEMFKK